MVLELTLVLWYLSVAAVRRLIPIPYFTVNPGQTAMWDSGFLMEGYTWRAFCRREISPNVLERPRPDMHQWIVQIL